MGQTQSMDQLLDEKKKGAHMTKDVSAYEKLLKLMETEKSMQQKLDCKKHKMYIEALNDECLPILCAVNKFDNIVVIKSTDIEDTKVGDELKKHLSGEYLTELISLLTTVLKSVVATDPNQERIEREIQQTHVVVANKSVIRIDYYLQFVGTNDVEHTLMYYVQVGVIDIAKARLPVLIYELTRATNDDQMKNAGDELKKRIDNTVHLFQAMQTLAKAARDRESTNPEEKQTQQQTNTNTEPTQVPGSAPAQQPLHTWRRLKAEEKKEKEKEKEKENEW